MNNIPVKAKKIASQIKTRRDWEINKLDLMIHLIKMKAHQCAEFKYRLKISQRYKLIHNVDCKFWGTGKNGRGQNMYGQILEQMRECL